jgi:hypothetical protein
MTEAIASDLFELGIQQLPNTLPNCERRWSQLKMTTVLRLVREAI